MAFPFLTTSQVLQSPIQSASQNSPFFFKLTIKSSYDTSTRPDKLAVLGSSSFSATSSSEPSMKRNLNFASHLVDEVNGSPIKQKGKHLDFEDGASRFRVQSLVDRIGALPSNKRAEILNILEKDHELKNISDFKYLLRALIIVEEFGICLRLLSNLSSYQVAPDCWTFSIMIRCYCEKNDPNEARRVLDTMLENGFQPNVATLTHVINSFCKRGRMQKAMEVFELMGRIGCQPTIQTFNCLLKGLCYVGKVEEALEMLVNIKSNNSLSKPDIYSYTSVMDGLCKVGRSDEARELLNEAVEMGLKANVVTFNTLFQGYSREGRPLEGVSVLKLMKINDCVPDYISYSTLLHGLLKWNKIRAASRIYKEMVSFGFEVDERMMETLLRRLCRKSCKERDLLEDAHRLFEKMKMRRLSVDQRTHELVIQALCVGGKADEALTGLKDMNRLGYSPGTIIFDTVIQALCALGMAQEAVSVLQLMRANGRIPDKISYNLLIEELKAQGMLICASNLFGAAMKQGVLLNKEPPVLCKPSHRRTRSFY